MADFGHFALCLGWILCLYGVLFGAYIGMKLRTDLLDSLLNSSLFVTLCCSIAIFCLGYSFLHDDYNLQYVWQFSNKDMLGVYKISAIWGGMDGSMLLWAFVLSISGAIVAWQARSYPRRLAPWVLAVHNSTLLFFLTVIVFFTNPFRSIKADFIPPDGNGLNPLLQNPLMVIHPPMLYLGFTTFAVPFAFCLGALISGQLSNEWIRLSRRYTLVAWGFLTTGIILGGHWAYVELGWGGFWAWDPVENASFLPWLTGTAFLHSVMVQERKNMLRLWNIWLIVLTYGLTVFGTFLTRSGIVQSVHAFAETDVGWIFLVYLALVFAGALALCIWRKSELRSERQIESFLSREAAFLINNLLLLAICFTTLWGVMFPILSEAVTGVKQTVSIPFFNAVNVPLFLGLIFMMALGPLIAWRKASLASLKNIFLLPFIVSALLGLILIWAGVPGFYPILAYSLSFFVLLTVLGEVHRGMRAQRALTSDVGGALEGTKRLLTRHRQRYGGYIVHLGVALATVGISASMAHKIERDIFLAPGESAQVGRYSIKLAEIGESANSNYQAVFARAEISNAGSGEFVKELKPELRSYIRARESTTEVALHVSLRDDLYLVLAGLDDTGQKAALKVFVNPLQVWLWFGGIIMLLGTIVVLLPSRRELRAAEKVPAAATYE